MESASLPIQGSPSHVSRNVGRTLDGNNSERVSPGLHQKRRSCGQVFGAFGRAIAQQAHQPAEGDLRRRGLPLCLCGRFENQDPHDRQDLPYSFQTGGLGRCGARFPVLGIVTE